MPRKSAAAAALTPEQAHYIVNRLIADRVINSMQVSEYLSQVNIEIAQLEGRLQALKVLSGSAVAPVSAPVAPVAPAARRRGRKARAKATSKAPASKAARSKGAKPKSEVAASMKLQGQYLGLLNRFKGAARERFKAIAKDKSREAAIAAMRAELGT